MPKIYGKNPLEMAGGKQDMSPSARLQMRRDLKQLGFAGASEALQPKKSGFKVVSTGSFQPHIEQLFWVRRSANNVAKMTGRTPDPTVEEATSGGLKSKPASKVWQKDHQKSGRLKSGEESFSKILDELVQKIRTTTDSLVYNKDFDMVTLKQMDRQTLAMYMAKAEADIAEVTTIYGQLMNMLPYIEAASGAVQKLTDVTSQIANIRGELSTVYRVFRQESMVIHSGAAKTMAGSQGEEEEEPGGGMLR